MYDHLVFLDREKHGKYLFLPLWKYGEFAHDSMRAAMIDEPQ